MTKDRTAIALFASLLALLLIAVFRSKPPAVTVLPLYYNPVNETNPVSERFWVLKAQAHTRFDLIVMGDSRVYRGISPQAMQIVLNGRRILNYGFSGGGLNPEMYAAAERRLDPASRQKAILLGISPQTLSPRTEANDHYNQELKRSPDYLFFLQYMPATLNLFEPVQVSRFASQVRADRSEPQEGYYLEFHDDGWVASWTIPELPDSQLESYRDIFSTTRVSPRLVDDLLRQTRLWVSRGIKVYAFRPPTSPAMLELENQMSGFNETGFAAQFNAAGGVWLSIPIAPYHSYDGSHLVKASAVQLSLDLAKLIEQAENR